MSEWENWTPAAETSVPVLSVLIPTIDGREAMLEKVKEAFRELHGDTVEILSTKGYSWGSGINELTNMASGQYWLFACDDTIPQPGWFDAARAMVDEGLTPASRYFHKDGTPLHERDVQPHGTPVEWCRSFLVTRQIWEEIGTMIDTTWWADIDYSERLDASGRTVTACDGYNFTHLDSERTWLTTEEEDRQRKVYEEAKRCS